MGECGIQKDSLWTEVQLRTRGSNEHQTQRNWAERHELDLTRDTEVGKADSKEKVIGGPE